MVFYVDLAVPLDNIVLDEDGRAQVIDWEMSYTADELGKSRFVVGTPGYIAPEGSVHDIVPFQTPVQLDFHKIQWYVHCVLAQGIVC